jgi:hypothetical protein
MANRALLAWRRYNGDRTWESICLRCYRTAASARDACWIALLQSTHICDPMDLHAWPSDREQFGLNPPQHFPSRTPHRKNLPVPGVPL